MDQLTKHIYFQGNCSVRACVCVQMVHRSCVSWTSFACGRQTFVLVQQQKKNGTNLASQALIPEEQRLLLVCSFVHL